MASGSQNLIGTDGNDFLKSNGNSNDLISGLGGDDDIDAGAGMDTIDGGEGNDVLNGGAHADTFVFGLNSGADIIEDFKSGEDTVDISATGIGDLTGRVSDDGNGNTVIDLGDGNSITLIKMDAATFLADASNYILAPVIELGIDDTFTDPGDGVDHIITGDVNGERNTDTDTFIFVPGSGDDTITDFREADFFLDPNGNPQTIAGDILDLSAYGIFGDDLTDTGHLGWFGSLLSQGLITDWFVSGDSDPVQQTIITFADGSSLTLLGIGDTTIGTVIEANIVRDTGGAV